MDPPGHRPVLCVVCGCEAHRFLEVGHLTLYLCAGHLDLCAQCLALIDERIADEGNICMACGGSGDAYAELGVYECTPGCATCQLLGP